MTKQQLDHVLRAAGRITGERRFVIIGSQALHGQHPDVANEILRSAAADLIVAKRSDRTEWLNAIGVHSAFHESFGYYADPVDEASATLPRGWKRRLVPLPPGDTDGVKGLCLDPHDLAISKYVARREKDLTFNRALVRLGIVRREELVARIDATPVAEEVRERMRRDVASHFDDAGTR
jgi:hypothetical protein